ncbi:MerR family transcriptional regulator [Streptomyces albus subsp. chlorinus]|uniref:MerR family transcriptional regulator n=1 Tax=Streptomyces albus TaxID=1888 RepID=UPI00156FD845|nr:MerR family transcriptional regulator [Streptomyces albus subsp. chlorinus]
MTVTETTANETTATESPRAAGPAPRPAPCAEPGGRHPRPDGQDRYTISEVAATTGLSAHTLRWYERIGLMPHVDRSHTGQRRFSNRDLDWLDLVGKLRRTGMTVADMVRYAELVREGERTFPERQALLEETRRDVLERIAELRDTLEVLDYKIDHYSRKTGGDLPSAARAAAAHAPATA